MVLNASLNKDCRTLFQTASHLSLFLETETAIAYPKPSVCSQTPFPHDAYIIHPACRTWIHSSHHAPTPLPHNTRPHHSTRYYSAPKLYFPHQTLLKMKRASSLDSLSEISDLPNLEFHDDCIELAEIQPASSNRSHTRQMHRTTSRLKTQRDQQRSGRSVRARHSSSVPIPDQSNQPSAGLFSCANYNESFLLESKLQTHQASNHKIDQNSSCDQ